MWRAIRYGQDGKLLDLEAPTIEEYPAAEALDRLKAWTGADVALPELNGAQRQRRMIDAGATPFEVFKQCVDETRATYPAQERSVSGQRVHRRGDRGRSRPRWRSSRVDDVLLQTIVHADQPRRPQGRPGRAAGRRSRKRDLAQTKQAIEARGP